MNDLISRQAVLKELPHALWGKEWDEALAKAIIESMPTIDPVKHGKWEKYGSQDKGMKWVCTACGGIAYKPFGRMEYGKRLPCDYKFCPNCGAQMEIEE